MIWHVILDFRFPPAVPSLPRENWQSAKRTQPVRGRPDIRDASTRVDKSDAQCKQDPAHYIIANACGQHDNTLSLSARCSFASSRKLAVCKKDPASPWSP
jgi:hypothetical protein